MAGLAENEPALMPTRIHRRPRPPHESLRLFLSVPPLRSPVSTSVYTAIMLTLALGLCAVGALLVF